MSTVNSSPSVQIKYEEINLATYFTPFETNGWLYKKGS